MEEQAKQEMFTIIENRVNYLVDLAMERKAYFAQLAEEREQLQKELAEDLEIERIHMLQYTNPFDAQIS